MYAMKGVKETTELDFQFGPSPSPAKADDDGEYLRYDQHLFQRSAVFPPVASLPFCISLSR